MSFAPKARGDEEVCLGCTMLWSSRGFRVPFLPNANMLKQFLLSTLFLSVFCFQIYIIIITAAMSGSCRGNEVISCREVFCPLSLWARGSSEYQSRLTTLSKTMLTTQTKHLDQLFFPANHKEQYKNNAQPCALLSLLSCILIYGCWVFPPCPPATKHRAVWELM